MVSSRARQSVTVGRRRLSRSQQARTSSTSSKHDAGCRVESRKVRNPASFTPKLSLRVSSMMSCASFAVSASQMTIPNEKMSAESPYSPRSTSGAWWLNVPTWPDSCSRSESLCALLSPKSEILTWPASSSSRFSALRSRCIMRSEWR